VAVELSGYLAILRRWWWTLLVAVWVAAILGYLVGKQIDPTYESSVRLLVGPINTDTNTLRASGQLVQTYAELAVSQPLLESTAKDLGLPQGAADELAGAVRTTANDQTRILTIRVQGPKAAETTQAANGIAYSLIELTTHGSSRPEGQVQVIDYATVPTSPVAPQISLIVLMSAAAGLLGALILVLLAEYLADRVQDADELARITGSRPLGVIPAGSPAPLAGLAEGTKKVPLDAYGSIVAALAFTASEEGRRELVIATGDRGVHGSDLALGFAAAAAEWRPVLYIDADPDGTASALLGVNATSSGGVSLARRVMTTPVDGLRILPVGAVDDLATISPAEARALLDQVAGATDTVIIDTGSLVAQPSAMVWAGVVGSALIAVRRGSTRRSDVREALTRLDQVRAQLVGSVLIESKASRVRGGRFGRSAEPVAAPDAVEPVVPPSRAMARGPRSDRG